MKKKEKWIVALDFTPMDLDILRFTKSLGTLLEPSEIVFVNVQKDEPWNPFLGNGFKNFAHIISEEKRLVLKEKVEQTFKDTPLPIEVKMLQGEPFTEIIDLANQRNTDLVIVGKKHQSNGSGILSIRLSKVLNSNFLLVPEGAEPHFQNVLVSSDFSEFSALGLKQALQLKKEVEGLKINIFNGFDVPSGFTKIGKSHDEFEEIMRENSEKALDHWLTKLGHTGPQILKSIENKSVTKLLLEAAKDINAGLIIMGSRGRTATTRILLGSHTWKLIQQNDAFPLLIVKKKDAHFTVRDLIRE